LRPYRPASVNPLAPLHDRIVMVTHCRPVCFGKRKINLSTVFLASPGKTPALSGSTSASGS